MTIDISNAIYYNYIIKSKGGETLDEADNQDKESGRNNG